MKKYALGQEDLEKKKSFGKDFWKQGVILTFSKVHKYDLIKVSQFFFSNLTYYFILQHIFNPYKQLIVKFNVNSSILVVSIVDKFIFIRFQKFIIDNECINWKIKYIIVFIIKL